MIRHKLIFKFMKPIKKILIPAMLIALSFGAKAQVSVSPEIGLSIFLPSSDNHMTVSPGPGITYGAMSQAALGYRFDLMSQYYIYAGEFGVQGKDLSNPSYPTTSNSLMTFGALYMIGVDYYIIHKQLYVSAAPFISYNECFGLSAASTASTN